MHCLSFLLFFSLYACNTLPGHAATTIAGHSSLQQRYLGELITKYGRAKVLTGLYFVDRNSLEPVSSGIDSSNLLYCRLEILLDKKGAAGDSLVNMAEDYFGRMAIDKRKQVLGKVGQWLRIDVLLSSVLDDNLGEGLFFEELINSIPEVKPLLNKYLKNPAQYWGSLDANQSCKLYYDVTAYLLGQDALRRIRFFNKYFDTACKLALKNSTKR